MTKFSFIILLSFFILYSIVLYAYDPNDPVSHPKTVNKEFAEYLSGKPIDFYLQHPEINQFAKSFYRQEFAVSDDNKTFSILNSVFTCSAETKPFYIFVLNSIVRLSDAALAEMVSESCLKFIKLNPCLFLKLKENIEYTLYYQKWLSLASYEFYFEVKSHKNETFNSFFTDLDTAVTDNCSNYSNEISEIKNVFRSTVKHMND